MTNKHQRGERRDKGRQERRKREREGDGKKGGRKRRRKDVGDRKYYFGHYVCSNEQLR